jgi:hypothetical protein
MEREDAEPPSFSHHWIFNGGRGPRWRAALTRAHRSLAEEAPPETTSVRLLYYENDATCIAPIDILSDLLRDEGFADVRYVPGAEGEQARFRHPAPTSGV